jgi:hypothetical protein
VRRWSDKKDPAKSQNGVLCASGLIAGEGIAGIALAIAVAAGAISKDQTVLISGLAGDIASLILTILIMMMLFSAPPSNRQV